MPDETTTVLILNSVKRVKSIKVNRARIRFAIFLVSTFCVILILAIIASSYLFIQNKNLQKEIASIENAENKLPAISGEEQPASTGSDTEQTVSGREESDVNAAGNPNEQNRSEDPAIEENVYEDDIESEIVSINNLVSRLELNGIELKFAFNIKNDLTTGQRIAGRIVVVAKTTDEDARFICWPAVDLNENGEPRNFGSGDRFNINNLKPIEGEIWLNNPAESFEFYRIYVYTLSGELLLRQTHLIEK